MSNRLHFLTGFVLLLGTAALAQRRPALEAALNRDFKGQVITQKQFACGTQVTYSADGHVASELVGSWTTCAKLRVLSMRLPDDQAIQIEAERVSLGYDGKRKDFGEVRDKDKKQNHVVLTIVMQAPLDEASVRAAMAKVFLQGDEHFSDFVPEYWKPFMVQREIDAGQRPKSDAMRTPSIEKVGEYILPPRPKYVPDPDYEPLAKKMKFQGTIILWMIVDESGKPRDIRITKPLGLGLDEKAVEAVTNWIFEPAKRKYSEKPAAVQISVEVNFRLY